MLPLSLTLHDADTSNPLLIEGKQPVRIEKAEIVQSKSGKGYFLAVSYRTVNDSTGSKGQHIKPNFPLKIQRYMIPIENTEFGSGEQAERYKTDLCRFMLACANLKDDKAGKNKASLPTFDENYVANLKDVIVMGNIKTEKDEEYGDQSAVKSVSGIDPQ